MIYNSMIAIEKAGYHKTFKKL